MLNNPMLRISAIIFIGIAFVFGILEGVYAHFHTFWPEDSPNCYAKRRQEITFKYFWGHPYEKIIFDTPTPNFYVVRPDGKKDKVSIKKIQMKDEETGEMRTAYEVKYKPTALGDSYLCLDAPPIFVEQEEMFQKR